MTGRAIRPLAGTFAICLLTGCFTRELRPLNDCPRSAYNSEQEVDAVDQLDVLFVIDDSISMRQEQAAIARQIPRMVELLASGGTSDDDEGDVVRNFTRVRSLHIGVVSTNMGGTPGGCTPAGDDGLLLDERPDTQVPTDGDYDWNECPVGGETDGFFAFEEGDDRAELSRRVRCAALEASPAATSSSPSRRCSKLSLRRLPRASLPTTTRPRSSPTELPAVTAARAGPTPASSVSARRSRSSS